MSEASAPDTAARGGVLQSGPVNGAGKLRIQSEVGKGARDVQRSATDHAGRQPVATCRLQGIDPQNYLAWAIERRGTWRKRYGLEPKDLTPAAHKRWLAAKEAEGGGHREQLSQQGPACVGGSLMVHPLAPFWRDRDSGPRPGPRYPLTEPCARLNRPDDLMLMVDGCLTN